MHLPVVLLDIRSSIAQRGSGNKKNIWSVGERAPLSQVSDVAVLPWRGETRFPLGVSFERAKETKTRLGRSPLSTPLGVRGWNCVKLVFGP